MNATTFSLEVIDIRNPCTAPWEKMTGDERSRHCGDCCKQVYNLSAMSRPEAEELIRAKEGKLCLRLFRRADGTVLTSECFGGWNGVRRRTAMFMAVACSLLVGASSLFGVTSLVLWWTRPKDPSGWHNHPIRQIEPFQTVLEWIDPMPRCIAGEMAPPPGPPPAPPAPPVPAPPNQAP